MSAIIITIHVLVCVFLILIVLLQTGKGAEIGATFGGSSQTVFGPRGAGTLLSRLTVVAAIVFMITSISLSYLKGRSSASGLLEKEVAPAGPVETAPVPTAPPLPDAGPGNPAPPAPQPSPDGK
ncbi:MAG: preprotein translocase subunit SecG [Proteobacteria bacterium]|nr:preprotein translocase subunit SecG [Pseudomonadota bacterium]